MPKKLAKKDLQEIESSVVASGLEGDHQWPIEVEVLGERARLRVVRDKPRIYFDWYIPEKYRDVLGRRRYLQQIPKPESGVPPHEDPGRNPDLAKNWLRSWLKEKVLEAEHALKRDGVVRDPSVPNDVPLRTLVRRFRESNKFTTASETQREQWDLWLDYFPSVLPGEFRMHQVSPDVLSVLSEGYQREWTRTREDGTSVRMNTGGGHNTSAKVVRFFRLVCRWAVSEPDGHGHYLLDTDPFERISRDDRKKFQEHETKRRPVGAASEAFTRAMVKQLAGTGEAGQALLIFGTEVALGRRPGEVRKLLRTQVLTTAAEIAEGLRLQACRRVLPDRHIPDEEIEEAAEAYAERGWAIRFMGGKQLSRDPGAAQHDRVVPLGRKLTAVYRRYLRDHWDPLGLGPEDWLCPARRNASQATSKDVADKWFKRARTLVAALDNPPRIPPGGSHTLRHRFRTVHRKQSQKSIGFIGGWSVKQRMAMDHHYLPVLWQDLVELVDRIDVTTAAVLEVAGEPTGTGQPEPGTAG